MIDALIVVACVVVGTVVGLAGFFMLAFIIIAHEEKDGH